VRQNGSTVRIIIMSAEGQAEPFFARGTNAFLHKPFDLDTLLDCIANHSAPLSEAILTSEIPASAVFAHLIWCGRHLFLSPNCWRRAGSSAGTPAGSLQPASAFSRPASGCDSNPGGASTGPSIKPDLTPSAIEAIVFCTKQLYSHHLLLVPFIHLP
jgi:hypothetical protein